MAESTSTAGTKRPHSDSTTEPVPHKKQRVRRCLQHVQTKPHHIEYAPQDPVFAQGQLLKSISAALAVVGFDSVKPTALEMFRGLVEEYMLRFLHYARIAMQTGRRTRPTALDFASALALMPNTSSASQLKPQLGLQIPEHISYPSILDPDPPPAPAPDFSTLLDPLLVNEPPKYIPRHFPQLPPGHAWKSTPDYSEKERDARKMREKATEEGMLAESALRKLAAAAKNGAVVAQQRRANTLRGPDKASVRSGKDSGGAKAKGRERSNAAAMFTDMLREVREKDNDIGTGFDGEDEEGKETVMVNHEMNSWRRGQQQGLHL